MPGFDLIEEGLSLGGELFGLSSDEEVQKQGQRVNAFGSVLGFVFDLLGLSSDSDSGSQPQPPQYPTIEQISEATAALVIKDIDETKLKQIWQPVLDEFGLIDDIFEKDIKKLDSNDDDEFLVRMQSLIGLNTVNGIQQPPGSLVNAVNSVSAIIESDTNVSLSKKQYPTHYGNIPLFFNWASLELFYVSMWYRIQKTRAKLSPKKENIEAVSDINRVAIDIYKRRIGAPYPTPTPQPQAEFSTGLTYYLDLASAIITQRGTTSALKKTEESERKVVHGPMGGNQRQSRTTGKWVATDHEYAWRPWAKDKDPPISASYQTPWVIGFDAPDATSESNKAYTLAHQYWHNYNWALHRSMITDLGMMNPAGMKTALDDWNKSLKELIGQEK